VLSLLQNLWDGIRSVPFVVADLLVAAFNLVIVAFSGLAGLVMGLLPGFPDSPGEPTGVIGILAWIAPLGAMVSGFAALTSAWVTFLVIRVALNWVKAL
jgi:hypothetical protein